MSVGAHQFDGNRTFQPRVKRAEYFAHAAFTDARVEAIVAKRASFHAEVKLILSPVRLYSAE